MSELNINNVLEQMRIMSIEAGGQPRQTESSSDFSAVLKQSIDAVNQSQKVSGQLQNDFEMGKSDVSLAEVMIASQKANVSFQAMVQVRNKLVDAYTQVMGMSM